MTHADHAPLATALLRLESLAARMEAHTAATPALGRLWRVETALTEAVRSVGLEGIRILEGDLVTHATENPAGHLSGRGLQAARDHLAALHRPGTLAAQPRATLARLAGPARAGGASAPGEDPRLAGADAPWPDDALAARVAADLQAGVGTFLPCLTVAARLATDCVPRRPALERLAFMAADASLRTAEAGGRTSHATGDLPWLESVAGAGQGSWVFLPATALSDGVFRAWSPLTRHGIEDLAAGLGAVLARELGRLGQIRHWLETRVPAFTAGPRRAGRRDLVAYILNQPLLTAPMAASALGTTGQTGRNLIDAAVDAGILIPVTRRARYRVFATPALAERLAARHPRLPREPAGDRHPRARPDPAPPDHPAPAPPAPPAPRRNDAEPADAEPADAAHLEALLHNVRAAMANIDTVVAARRRDRDPGRD